MSQDTYRKHPKPKAFDSARDVVVGRLLDMIEKAGLTAHGIRTRTGIDFDNRRLTSLRAGEVEAFSDNMLMLLYERLGGRLTLTVH